MFEPQKTEILINLKENTYFSFVKNDLSCYSKLILVTLGHEIVYTSLSFV